MYPGEGVGRVVLARNAGDTTVEPAVLIYCAAGQSSSRLQ
jgi:hypothetical protein